MVASVARQPSLSDRGKGVPIMICPLLARYSVRCSASRSAEAGTTRTPPTSMRSPPKVGTSV